MELRTYQELYDALGTRGDMERLQRSTDYDDELLLVIHTARVVREATKQFYKVKRHARRLHKQWKMGTTLTQLADAHAFPPILMSLIVLEREQISKKRFWKILDNLDGVRDERLRRELREVREEDIIYSPEGTERQNQRGAWGEDRLRRWLEAHDVPFETEEDLRHDLDKTPDALLSQPMTYNGREIYWVESKASFGDPFEIRRHIRRQLKPYVERYGEGLVVYWFGYVEDVDLHLPKGVSITDGRDFGLGA